MRRLVAAFTVGLGALALGAAAWADSAQQTRVELSIRPATLGALQLALLTGRVASVQSGEEVELQVKPCGMPAFHGFTVLHTRTGGTFDQDYAPGINASVRAVWKGSASAPVSLEQAPLVRLDRRGARRFEVGIGSLGWMWRKKVSIQRRQGGRWVTIKLVAVTKTYSSPGAGSGTWTEAEFPLRVPAGSTLRAVLPITEAKPCYLAGVSKTVRT